MAPSFLLRVDLDLHVAAVVLVRLVDVDGLGLGQRPVGVAGDCPDAGTGVQELPGNRAALFAGRADNRLVSQLVSAQLK